MIQEQTSAVRSALRTFANEREGLEALEEAIRTAGDGGLGAAFSEAVKTISAAPGRVIVTGIGKSGHVGRKIAATLASTGEPASFVHPAEASHGDLGMVQSGDVVLAISWSGQDRWGRPPARSAWSGRRRPRGRACCWPQRSSRSAESRSVWRK